MIDTQLITEKNYYSVLDSTPFDKLQFTRDKMKERADYMNKRLQNIRENDTVSIEFVTMQKELNSYVLALNEIINEI